MKNAKCADIIFELAWYAFLEMSSDDTYPGSGHDMINPRTGQTERQWFHGFYSSGEWTADLLVKVGVFEAHGPYHSPLMSLDQVRDDDFSRFEHPDCYTECMRAMCELCSQFWSSSTVERYKKLRPQIFSSKFRDSVVIADDLFVPDAEGLGLYDSERFHEKVLRPWMQLSERGLIGRAFKPGPA